MPVAPPQATDPRLPRDAGVTLIEVLVVLALIGVMAGSVSIGLGRIGHDDRLAQAADLLVVRLQAVADAAVRSGADAALVWDRDGYGFVVAGADGWAPAVTAFPPHQDLPGGIILSTPGSAHVIRGDALPGSVPLALTLEGSGAVVGVLFDGLTVRLAEWGELR